MRKISFSPSYLTFKIFKNSSFKNQKLTNNLSLIIEKLAIRIANNERDCGEIVT